MDVEWLVDVLHLVKNPTPAPRSRPRGGTAVPGSAIRIPGTAGQSRTAAVASNAAEATKDATLPRKQSGRRGDPMKLSLKDNVLVLTALPRLSGLRR